MISRNKKILIISRNFPPLIGGMERLIFHVYQELRKEFNCHVIGPIGSKKYGIGDDLFSECSVLIVHFFLVTAFMKGILATYRHRFDLCFAGSGVAAPVALAIGKIFRIPVAVYVHGLDLIADNFIYQKFFIPAICHADLVIANSSNTARIAKEKGVNESKIHILNPGVSIVQPEDDFLIFKDTLGLQNKKILLSVGRLIARKGIAEFIRYSLPSIVEKIPECILLIIGSFPKNAIRKKCKDTDLLFTFIRESGMSDNVKMIGNVDDAVLQGAFKSADLFVFPVLDIPGDVEGFGMVAVEAAAHGLPTIAFNSGGVSDAIVDGLTGFLIHQGNYMEFSEKIISFLSGTNAYISPDDCRQFANKFSWINFGRKLRIICKKCL